MVPAKGTSQKTLPAKGTDSTHNCSQKEPGKLKRRPSQLEVDLTEILDGTLEIRFQLINLKQKREAEVRRAEQIVAECEQLSWFHQNTTEVTQHLSR